MSVTWEHVLDDCEARLDAAGAAIEQRGVPALAPFVEPDLDEPMPALLADRARDLLTRSAELEERLAGELERIRSELRRLPRMPAAAREARFDAQA